jgi:hypothetical protein
MRRLCERGQAMTEYITIVGLTTGLLFVPWLDGKSVFLLFVEAFNIYLKSFHNVICLPVP